MGLTILCLLFCFAAQVKMWTWDESADQAFSLTVIPSASFYNTRLALWEPLVESFRLEARLMRNEDAMFGKQSELNLTGSSRINFNLTEDGARLLIKLLNEVSRYKKPASAPGFFNMYIEVS